MTIDNNVDDIPRTTEVENLSEGHASRYDPDDLSVGHASLQEFLISKAFVPNTVNVLPENISEGHASRHGPDNVYVGHASQQEPFISNVSVPNAMNVLS